MIYNVVNRTVHFVEGETSEQIRERQKRMVETGIWYVRTAREGLGSVALEGEAFLRSLYTDMSV
jgi:hypothetical protein